MREKASLKTHNSLSRRKASLNSVGTSEGGKIGSLWGGGGRGKTRTELADDARKTKVDVDWKRKWSTRAEVDSEKGAEKIRSTTIPRVTSSTYFQVNDNYYPGRTCAAVRRPQLPQIIALFIPRWVDPRSVSPFGKHRVFRRFCDVRSLEISRGEKKRENDFWAERTERTREDNNASVGNVRIYYSLPINRETK